MAEKNGNGLAVIQPNAGAIMESVIAKGNLADLTPTERVQYYMRTCESMGLNPLTKPFDYINLNGKLTLYATKTATDQLRTVKGVSITRIEAETTADGLRIVTAYARDAAGREDSDLGVVNVKGMQGDALANAYMKALTKAKRRVTLSICGLGWMDESEIETVPTARVVAVDHETGEIVDAQMPATHAVVPQDASNGVTQAQLKFIHKLAGEKGITNDGIKALHGKASAKDLTKQEASALIETLQSYPDIVLDEAEYEDAPMFDDGDPDRFTR